MIVFGAAFGNMFHGVPFHFEWNITSIYTGSFLALLNPFADDVRRCCRWRCR